jgi:hypothetical protein
MDKIKLKSESLPTRCEICHQSDCFDPKVNFCTRCAGIPTVVPSRYNSTTDFLDAINDARFVKTFGIISLVGLLFFGLGKAVGVGVGLAVLWYSKNNYYRMLGTIITLLSFILSPIISFWTLSTAVFIKGYDIIKILRQHSNTDPDWQNTQKRAITGMVTSALGFFISLTIILVMMLNTVMVGLKNEAVEEIDYKNSDNYDKSLSTPLLIQATIKNDKDTVINILIDDPSTIEVKDNSGTTALIYAAQLGYTELVKILAETGANLDSQDVNGQTALMYAAMMGHTETVRELVYWGAKKDIKNNSDYTALDYAKQKNYTQIIEILTENTKN